MTFFLHDDTLWAIFFTFILGMLIVDLIVFNKVDRKNTCKEAIGWTFFWIVLALIFSGCIYYEQGPSNAVQFISSYIVEKVLSLDNLFVFFLLFTYFKTPQHLIRTVLFWGVLGAIILRAICIWLGTALLTRFQWIPFLFGIILLLSGIKFWYSALNKKKIHPERAVLLRLLCNILPCTSEYEGSNFFIKREGRYLATPLFVTLLAIEMTDLLFAIDSIPAAFAITTNPFLVYTSNIFAVLGLRSLYFVIAHSIQRFFYLQFALSFILIYVGVKMLLAKIGIDISPLLSLAVIMGIVGVALVMSFVLPQKKVEKEDR